MVFLQAPLIDFLFKAFKVTEKKFALVLEFLGMFLLSAARIKTRESSAIVG